MNELFWLLMLLFCFFSILLVYRFYGKVGLFIWIPIAIIVANIQVLKTIELFGFTTTLGNIVYGASFLVTDILSENYGKKDARRAVEFGFIALLAMTVFMNLALRFIPGADDFAHDSLSTIFSFMPRIALASLTAYGVSQLHDIAAYNFWKKVLSSQKFIAVRNNLSTLVSQLIDTAIFCSIAFIGVFPMPVLIDIFITTYLFKFIVAASDTPFIYIANFLQRKGWVREC